MPVGSSADMHTRIAPTPSGFLHLGNAANALATAWWAEVLGGSLHLRIDDLDGDRVRPEYVEDILDLLTWLGIDWDTGPRSQDEASRARMGRVAACRDALAAALDAGLPAYACRCSRRQLAGVAVGGCPGGCRHLDLDLHPQQTALRLAVDPATTVDVDGTMVDLAMAMGDFVIWRRDDLPAYQWASVIEDDAHAITHILRGRDLVESTAAQTHLATLLDLPHAPGMTVRHHELVLDPAGRKLSKSQMSTAQGLPRTTRTREQVTEIATDICRTLGIGRP